MAKSDIGTITVYLRAESSNFDRSLRQAGLSLKGFENAVKKTGIAFTGFESKMNVIAGAVEGSAKLIEAGMLLWKGEWDKVDEMMESMPLGIGRVAKALHSLTDEMFGVVDAAKAMEEANKRMSKAQEDRIKFAVAATSAIVEQAKITEEAEERLARMGMSDAAKARRDVIQASSKARAEIMEAAKGSVPGTVLTDLGGGKGVDISQDTSGDLLHNRDRGFELMRETEQKLALVEEEKRKQLELLRIEQDRIRANEDIAYITQNVGEAIDAQRKSAREQMADIRARGTHEVRIMTQRGVSQDKILARQLKMQHDIAAVIEGWVDDVTTVTFDRPLQQAKALEEIEREKAKHVASMRRDVESQLAAQLAKTEKDGPTGASNAFSTAVGQIVLPDARATQDIQRAQLREQQQTVAAIDSLRDELALLTQGNP